MPATIKIKNSSTTGAVPTSSDLVQGELAVNVTDLGLYTENASGTVVKLNAPSIDDKNTGATKHLTISTSGNLGLGVTPSAWNSDYRALDVSNYGNLYGRIATPNVGVVLNGYRNSGGSWIYKTTNAAARYEQDSGFHIWYTAATGTAGNAISFTQAMTLDASGRLGIGSTSPSAKLTLKNPSSSGEQIIANIESASSSSVVGRLTYDQTNDIMRLVNMSSYSGAGLRFGVNGLDQVNIDLSGNLLVGTTSGIGYAERLAVVNNSSAANSQIAVFQHSGATSPRGYRVDFIGAAPNNTTQTFAVFGDTGANRFIVYSNGNVVNTNNSYGALSDIKLKENITDATPKLEQLNQVRVVSYNLIGETQKQLGVVAQELEQIFPGMVEESPDTERITTTDEDGNELVQEVLTGTTTKSVKYSVFVPMLIKAIQEQQAIITSQQAAIDQLMADVAALKGA
jgi:hypothetical protein